MKDNTPETKQRDPREHAAAKADINIKLKKKVSELTEEAAQIDDKIGQVELAAAREKDEARVVQLLAERKQLLERKDALPFILRGVQSRALCDQADALSEEAAEIKVDLDAAESELAAATARVPELQKQLDEAIAAVTEITQRRDVLSRNHADLEKAAGYARADARCIERGEAPKFEPGRFIGL